MKQIVFTVKSVILMLVILSFSTTGTEGNFLEKKILYKYNVSLF